MNERTKPDRPSLRMKSHFRIHFAITLFLFAFVCHGEENLKKTTLVTLWSPQSQFAGYYVAYKKGIYKKHGLDLTIIPGGHDKQPIELLEAGKADFGIAWLSSAIIERSRGVPLVNLAQITQRSALMLVAKKKNGIRTPQDMNGKRVSLWEKELRIPMAAFLKKNNLNVTIIPQGYTINLFLRDGVDVISAMWYNEYHTILNSGVNEEELTTFFLDQHGLDFPEDGIYVMEDKIAKDPEQCNSFVKASLEGWAYAFAHEEEALEIVLEYMKEAKIPANRIHQRWMLEKMKELMLPDGSTGITGALNENDYERVAHEMFESGALEEVPDYDSFYKPAKLQ